LTIVVSIFLNILLCILYSLIESNIDFLFLVILSITIAVNASIQQFILFKENHKLNGIIPVLSALLNLVFLFIFKATNILVIAYLLSSLILTLVSILWLLKNWDKKHIISTNVLRKVFRENVSFVKFIFPSSIATILIAYFHPVLLSYLFTSSQVGLFSFALRILLLPSIVIGSVTGALLRSTLSRLRFEGNYLDIKEEVRKIIIWLVASCIVCFPVLIFFVFQIKKITNISRWAGIEHISILLVLYAISQFFFIPLSNIPLVFDKKKILLNFNITQLFLTIIVYALSYLLAWEFETFIITISIIMMIFSLISCYCFIKIIKERDVQTV